MLDYNQRELLEEIEYSGMDVESYIDELIGSRTIKNLRENLLTLIIEAKHLVEIAEQNPLGRGRFFSIDGDVGSTMRIRSSCERRQHFPGASLIDANS